MPVAIMRLNFIQPGLEPNEMSARYKAGIDMAEWADKLGFMAISHEEHHGAANGWSPSPLITALNFTGSKSGGNPNRSLPEPRDLTCTGRKRGPLGPL